MASVFSAEASAQAHLHLDPSLQMPIKSEFEDCCPFSKVLTKLFCCGGCFKSSCCNTTIEIDDHPIYCHETGRCEIFDADKVEDSDAAIKMTAERIKILIEREKRLSAVRLETGIDLDYRAKEGHPITFGELKRIGI